MANGPTKIQIGESNCKYFHLRNKLKQFLKKQLVN